MQWIQLPTSSISVQRIWDMDAFRHVTSQNNFSQVHWGHVIRSERNSRKYTRIRNLEVKRGLRRKYIAAYKYIQSKFYLSDGRLIGLKTTILQSHQKKINHQIEDHTEDHSYSTFNYGRILSKVKSSCGQL